MPRQNTPNRNRGAQPPNPFDAPSGLAPRQMSRTASARPAQGQRRNGNSRQQSYASPVPTMTSMPSALDAQDDVRAVPTKKQKKGAKQGKASKQNKVNPKKSVQQQVNQRGKGGKAQKEGTLFQRVKFFVQTNSPGEIIQQFCEWFDARYYIALAIAVIGIIIGLLFSRYISFGFAFVLVLFGVIMSRKGLDRGEYACYISAALAFIIPYLF